ncbi:MAG TPA: hypothetical protein VGP72_28220 [Planctomycetota bacterium]|jgi:hypothetical protein
MADPIDEVKGKSKEFIEKAKSGTLDENTLKWGLCAGSIVAGVSLLFNYASWDIQFGGGVFHSGGISGLDLLSFRGGGLRSLEAIAIPLTALFGLYLHFGEPSFKLLKMETPGRPKLVYLIGMIVGTVGVIGCLDFLRMGVCLGNLLGLFGLGLLAFVFFKLWQLAPEVAAGSTPPTDQQPASPPSTPPAETAAKCGQCGKPRREGATFCDNCGQKF